VPQVEQDGSFKVVDYSNRGGRTFFGLGSLLTGYKVNTILHCRPNTRCLSCLFTDIICYTLVYYII